MPGKEKKISFKKERLKEAMKEKRFTRSALCEKVGLSPDTFGGYMRTGKIMPDVLEKICVVLDCDEDYIAGFKSYEEAWGAHENVFFYTDMFKSVSLQISKPEFYATLFEMHGFPPETIRSIREDPFSTGYGRGYHVLDMLYDFMEKLKADELVFYLARRAYHEKQK